MERAGRPGSQRIALTGGRIAPEAVHAAKSAELRYVSDAKPGIRRAHTGKAFKYIDPNGKTVKDPDALLRIRRLAIPPAWRDVWISPFDNGHIQAVGRDDRGRKQYRYHARWREVRDQSKYDRMIKFARSLPTIRRRAQRDLSRRALTREKVLAAVVRIMEKTLIRVGNDEYANHNNSYGLTTFQDRHARVNGTKIRFEFKGKSGREHEIDVNDARLARIVEKCQDLPGEELFQYVDEDGQIRDIGSSDVNEYLRQITGEDFTAKDFRTWAGTVLTARALQELSATHSNAPAKRNIVRAVEAVAMKLGNTTAVCRKCYIHPAILNSYMDGSLTKWLQQKAARELARAHKSLTRDEKAVLKFLERQLGRKPRSSNGRT